MINDLPLELIYQIIIKLDNYSVHRLIQINQLFHLIGQDEHLWYCIFKTTYPHIYVQYEQPLLLNWKGSVFDKKVKSILWFPLLEYNWNISEEPSKVDIYKIYPSVNYRLRGPLTLLFPISQFTYGYYDFIIIDRKHISKEDLLLIIYNYYKQPLTIEYIKYHLELYQQKWIKEYPQYQY